MAEIAVAGLIVSGLVLLGQMFAMNPPRWASGSWMFLVFVAAVLTAFASALLLAAGLLLRI